MTRNPRIILSVLAALACVSAVPAAAGDRLSLTGEYTAGSHYHGYEARTGLDLGADKTWGLDASYAVSDSTGVSPSRTRQVTAGLSHDMDDSWNARFSLTRPGGTWSTTWNTAGRALRCLLHGPPGPGVDDGGGASDELFRTSYHA